MGLITIWVPTIGRFDPRLDDSYRCRGSKWAWANIQYGMPSQVATFSSREKLNCERISGKQRLWSNFITITWALWYHTLPLTLKWWKKWVDYLEIKFHLNENIKWHCMQLEVNSNSIEEKQDPNLGSRYWKYAHHFRHHFWHPWLWYWIKKETLKNYKRMWFFWHKKSWFMTHVK
jgi:hypothetical protein